MAASDVFQRINALDGAGLQRIVDRLEFRGTYPPFVAMRDHYLERMDLAPDATILDLGCGTGVVARAIGARPGFRGRVVGVDVSPGLLEAGRRFAEREGVASRVTFRAGDAERLEDADASYDAVILHTLVSHVPAPGVVVAEAARVVRPGGSLAIFDGDYASLSFATGDRVLDDEMVRAMLAAVVANPYIMRELPPLVARAGLQITEFVPGVVAEAGRGEFFASMAESFTPIAVNAGLVSTERADRWLAAARRAAAEATFFASCNYYSYLARRTRGAGDPGGVSRER